MKIIIGLLELALHYNVIIPLLNYLNFCEPVLLKMSFYKSKELIETKFKEWGTIKTGAGAKI